jgi:hypothetical protein
MTQQIMDMIARMGGADGIAAMAAKVGITPEQAESAVAALVPAVTGGMAKQAQAGNGSLVDQLAGMAAAYTGSAAGDGAVAQGNEILGNIFGSKDVSRAVAAQAAGKTGIDAGALAALLPMVATMAASALGGCAGRCGRRADEHDRHQQGRQSARRNHGHGVGLHEALTGRAGICW